MDVRVCSKLRRKYYLFITECKITDRLNYVVFYVIDYLFRPLLIPLPCRPSWRDLTSWFLRSGAYLIEHRISSAWSVIFVVLERLWDVYVVMSGYSLNAVHVRADSSRTQGNCQQAALALVNDARGSAKALANVPLERSPCTSPHQPSMFTFFYFHLLY